MLTDGPNGANSPPRAVMLTIAELAARDGVSKPTVSIAVKKLIERAGLTVERDAQGRVARVNAAEYDHLRGRYGDPSKAQAPARVDVPAAEPPPTAPLKAADGYDEALRQKTWIDAETRRLDLNQKRGNLVRRDRVEEALRLCVDPIARAFDRLPQEADELADAYERNGIHGLRQALKELARKGRTAAADALDSAFGAAPETDEPLPFTEGTLL